MTANYGKKEPQFLWIKFKTVRKENKIYLFLSC